MKTKLIVAFLSTFVLTYFSNSILEVNEGPIGRVTALDGLAFVKKGDRIYPLEIGSPVFSTDFIAASGASSVTVTFKDHKTLRIAENPKLSSDRSVYYAKSNPTSTDSYISIENLRHRLSLGTKNQVIAEAGLNGL